MDSAVSVCLKLCHCVAINIGVDMIGQLRLLVFYVYLAGDTLVAVLDGRSTFRHLNALHPRTWYVAQGIRSRCSPEIGNILGHHLDVRS